MTPLARTLPLLLLCVALAGCGRGGEQDQEEEAPPSGPTTTVPVALAPLAEPVACYTGPDGTAGVGVCHRGVRTFPNGPCLGEVVPTPEVCNGRDDDCNGTVDDGLGVVTCGLGACEASAPACVDGKPGICTPGRPGAEKCDGIDNDCDGVVDEDCPCVHVAPGGDDAGPGSAERPLRSIGAGIRLAAAGGQPRRVCVAAGSHCPASFDYPEAITMVDGVSVFGGYEANGAAWVRAGCITRILAQDGRGVFFDASVVTRTALDGFTVLGGDEAQNAAITIAGSTGAVVSNDVVHGGSGDVSFGVYVREQATPRVVRSTIAGGHGRSLAAGIQSDHSAPVIQGNCSAFDSAGRCATGACQTWSGFVRGSEGGVPAQISVGVRLEESPGTLVAQNAVCAESGTALNAGIQIFGDATGTVVRGNTVLGGAAMRAAGILLDDCDGAAPWLFDNPRIAARNDHRNAIAAGVNASGDCHPRIDSNQAVVGNEAGNGDTDAITCSRKGGIASRCIVEGNAEIVGSVLGVPAVSTGVRCEDGGCARIARNGHISGRGGKGTIGIALRDTDTLVDANLIEGGCGASGSTGVLISDSAARVQNNVVLGSICPPGVNPTIGVSGLRLLAGRGGAEADVHSNTILVLGSDGPCLGAALVFDFARRASGPTRRGLVRNNVLDGGLCARTFAVEEASPGSGPRVLLNNDLWRAAAAAAPVALYKADGARELRSVAEIESIPGLRAHGNITAMPLAGPQGLTGDSPCRNAGTDEDAPAYDRLGRPRPAELRYDIGAQEFVP